MHDIQYYPYSDDEIFDLQLIIMYKYMLLSCMSAVTPACRVIGCGVRPHYPLPVGSPPYCACDAKCRSKRDCCNDYTALCKKGEFKRLVALRNLKNHDF